MPTAEEFREQLLGVFRRAEQKRQASVLVKAGDLHRVVGGYPNRNTQRMPVCCNVMRGAMHRGDVIVSEPPKGQGATLTIRYELPRTRQGGTA
jgi:5-methylcytosine-specific restriction protein A